MTVIRADNPKSIVTNTAGNMFGLSDEQIREAQQNAMNYSNSGNLQSVADPDAAYAQITRAEYNDYVANYRDYEEGLIEQAQNDTGLIDAAREDSVSAAQLSQGVAQRNISRYGAALTPVQQQQMQKTTGLANTLGSIQAINDARIAQKEANTALLSDLINIGQGVNRASQNQLGSAAADASAREQAYRNAKAQSRAQTYQTVGGLASAAIMASIFI